jgi:chromate transporter
MSTTGTTAAAASAEAAAALGRLPSFAAAVRVWLKIGLLSFGGPAGQIALLHREVVDDRHWIGERRFLQALNFCTLLPGPEAQRLATYLGWIMHGVKGGLAAGLLFILPGAAVMLVLSVIYATLGEVPLVAALFFLNLPFPAVVLAAGMIGFLAPGHFSAGGHGKAKGDAVALIDAVLAADPGRPARLAADIAWFFSKMAVVTVGGAYAVLAYVAQDAVQAYGWLSPTEMLAGLGLAETTPGPLILVLQFVGFLAGFRAPERLSGLGGGIIASLLVLWVTFAPCFAFVFLGAPVIEKLQDNKALSGALAAITAAVVGVVANLAVWFGLRVLFRDLVDVRFGPVAVGLPVPTSLDLAALSLAVLAAVALFRLKQGVLRTLGITAAAGVVLHLLKLL